MLASVEEDYDTLEGDFLTLCVLFSGILERTVSFNFSIFDGTAIGSNNRIHYCIQQTPQA